MNRITINSVEPNSAPKFFKTELINAIRDDGLELKWERIKGHDSVHVLVDNIDTKSLLLVRQVRIPVLVNDPESGGIVIEACAGLVDKDKPLEQIVIEEVQEELNFYPVENKPQYIKTLKAFVGGSGTNAHLYTLKVRESEFGSNEGRLHEEDIETVEIPYNKVREWIDDTTVISDGTTNFLLTHWLLNR